MYRMFRLSLGCFLISLLSLSAPNSAPYPSAPGEILVQVRVPVINQDKNGTEAYDLPPLIQNKLESHGLILSKPLSKPPRSNKSLNRDSTGSPGVFLLQFEVKEAVESLVEKAQASLA